MALVDCPECSEEVSEDADACPHCGYTLEAEDSEKGCYGCLGIFGVSVLVGVLLTLCNLPASGPNPTFEPVSQSEFEGTWPFTVASGEVGCFEDDVTTVPLFRAEGETYALVGHGYTQYEYEKVSPIWKDDPHVDDAKVSTADISTYAESLCE
jgi:hypothetical protein